MRSKRVWRFTWGVTVTWVLVACSGGDSSGGAAQGPVECYGALDDCGEGRTCAYVKTDAGSKNLCVPVECATLDACCTSLPSAEIEPCRDLAAPLVAADCATELHTRRAAGYCVVDPAGDRMCNLNDHGCSVGLVPGLMNGNDTAGCCTGSICFTGAADGTDGTCISCQAAGAACDTSSTSADTCCPGTHCSGQSRSCVALQPTGGACASLFDCEGMLSCINGVCAYPSGTGGSGGGTASGGSSGTCDPSSCNGLDCADGFCCSSFCEAGSCQTVCN